MNPSLSLITREEGERDGHGRGPRRSGPKKSICSSVFHTLSLVSPSRSNDLNSEEAISMLEIRWLTPRSSGSSKMSLRHT